MDLGYQHMSTITWYAAVKAAGSHMDVLVDVAHITLPNATVASAHGSRRFLSFFDGGIVDGHAIAPRKKIVSPIDGYASRVSTTKTSMISASAVEINPNTASGTHAVETKMSPNGAWLIVVSAMAFHRCFKLGQAQT